MEQNEKVIIMSETAQHLVDVIQRRMNNKFSLLNSLQSTAIDDISNEVKVMREIESKAIRAVMQEQSDIIDIINALFPKVKVMPMPKPAMINLPDDDLAEINAAKKTKVTPIKKRNKDAGNRKN